MVENNSDNTANYWNKSGQVDQNVIYQYNNSKLTN